MSLSKEHYRIVLRLVGILILVNHYVLELVPVVLEDIRIVLKEMHHVDEDIVEVHGIVLAKLLIVLLIYLCRLLA